MRVPRRSLVRPVCMLGRWANINECMRIFQHLARGQRVAVFGERRYSRRNTLTPAGTFDPVLEASAVSVAAISPRELPALRSSPCSNPAAC